MEFEDETFATRKGAGGATIATVLVGLLAGLAVYGVALAAGLFH